VLGYIVQCTSQDSSLGTTGLWLDGLGFESPKCPDQLWGPPSLLFSGYQGSFLGVKQLGHEVNHSPLSSAEVKSQ
jgi:hypothetical protein